jgi:oligoendopeptidase F
MGLFGPSAAERAQSSVNTALGIQKKTIKALRRQNKKLRQRGNRQQETISSLAPMGSREATTQLSQDFYKALGNIGTQYSRQLSQFDPNLLASQSSKRFAGMLSASMNDYTNRLNQASQAGSARLYAALSAPITQFRQISEDPAFNNLLNQTFMAYAANPPTVTSDVESMKPLYTYNV